MSDAVDASSPQAGIEPVEATGERPGAPHVIYDEVRDPAKRMSRSVVAAALAQVFTVAGYIAIVEFTKAPPSSMRTALLGVGFLLTFVAVMQFTRRYIDWKTCRRWEAQARELRARINDQAAVCDATQDELIDKLLRTLRFRLRHSTQRDAGAAYVRECCELGRPAPRALVHVRATEAADLRSISLIAEMLEPEFVDEQRVNPWQRYISGAVGFVVLVLLASSYGIDIWMLAYMGAIWACFVGVHHCEFTQAFPFIRYVSRRWIAAPGCVQLLMSKGVAARNESDLWSVQEAMLEVEQPPFTKGIRVRLLGEKRSPWCSYDSIYNPGFIALWRRWNHPHPRPELLLGEEAASASADSR